MYFDYQYNPTSFNVYKAGKTRLMKEARRLSNLVKTRQRKIKKRGLESVSLDRLTDTIHEIYSDSILGNERSALSVTSSSEKWQLQAQIKAYQKYLESPYSTAEQIQNAMNQYEKYYDFANDRPSYYEVQNVTENFNDYMSNFGSDQIKALADFSKENNIEWGQIKVKIASLYNKLPTTSADFGDLDFLEDEIMLMYQNRTRDSFESEKEFVEWQSQHRGFLR